MPSRDRRPQFEPGLAGFIRPSRTNLLAALATVLPPETIATLKAALEAKAQESVTVEGDDTD